MGFGLLEVLTELGLDAGPVARYLGWVGGMLVGDFGISYAYRTPVAEIVLDRLQVSLPLALLALGISTAIAFPVGIWAAARRGTAVDAGIMGATQLGIAVPNFWFAMLLVLVFAVKLRWVSAGGFPGWNGGFWPGLRALLLPAVALALPQAAFLARVMRSSLLDTLHEDYMRTARAKGLSEGQAVRRHAIRNALIPVMTIIGLQFSFLLAGAIVIENVFFLPGLGRLIYQAVIQRDLIVVESVVLLLVGAVVLVTFAVELYNKTMTNVVLSWDDSGNNQYLASGVGSFIQNPISALRTIEDSNKDLAAKIAVGNALAGPKARVASCSGATWGLMDYSKNQAAAKAFLLDYYAVYGDGIKASKGFYQPMLKDFRKKPMPILGEYPRLAHLQDFDQIARASGHPGPPSVAASEVESNWIIPLMIAQAVQTNNVNEAINWAEGKLAAVYDKYK